MITEETFWPDTFLCSLPVLPAMLWWRGEWEEFCITLPVLWWQRCSCINTVQWVLSPSDRSVLLTGSLGENKANIKEDECSHHIYGRVFFVPVYEPLSRFMFCRGQICISCSRVHNVYNNLSAESLLQIPLSCALAFPVHLYSMQNKAWDLEGGSRLIIITVSPGPLHLEKWMDWRQQKSAERAH